MLRSVSCESFIICVADRVLGIVESNLWLFLNFPSRDFLRKSFGKLAWLIDCSTFLGRLSKLKYNVKTSFISDIFYIMLIIHISPGQCKITLSACFFRVVLIGHMRIQDLILISIMVSSGLLLFRCMFASR